MMEIFSQAPVRGNLETINSLARTYPMGVTCNSDQELKSYAHRAQGQIENGN